jgi:hypothetical protein
MRRQNCPQSLRGRGGSAAAAEAAARAHARPGPRAAGWQSADCAQATARPGLVAAAAGRRDPAARQAAPRQQSPAPRDCRGRRSAPPVLTPCRGAGRPVRMSDWRPTWPHSAGARQLIQRPRPHTVPDTMAVLNRGTRWPTVSAGVLGPMANARVTGPFAITEIRTNVSDAAVQLVSEATGHLACPAQPRPSVGPSVAARAWLTLTAAELVTALGSAPARSPGRGSTRGSCSRWPRPRRR